VLSALGERDGAQGVHGKGSPLTPHQGDATVVDAAVAPTRVEARASGPASTRRNPERSEE